MNNVSLLAISPSDNLNCGHIGIRFVYPQPSSLLRESVKAAPVRQTHNKSTVGVYLGSCKILPKVDYFKFTNFRAYFVAAVNEEQRIF